MAALVVSESAPESALQLQRAAAMNPADYAAIDDSDDEYWGLPTPPLDDEAFMLDQYFSPDLSKILEDDNGGGVGVRNHIKNKQHHGKGKELRVLQEIKAAAAAAAAKKEEITGSNIQVEKKDISLLDEATLNLKLERSKRKLSDGYKQAEQAKKQRRIQVIDIKNLPKETSCRAVKPLVKRFQPRWQH